MTTTASSAPLAAQYEDRVAAAIEQEDAHREETIAQARRIIAAGDEPGFCGDLRRAIHTGSVPLEKLAAAAQIDAFALCDFLEGSAELTTGQVAAITKMLGLQLMRTIPAESEAKRR